MPGSQGSGPGLVGVNAVRRQSRMAAKSAAVREVASTGGCQHVAEGVLTGFGREGNEVCSEGWPCGFGGQAGDVLVGFVQLCDGRRSDEFFGSEVEGVGVALDGVEEPDGGVVEFAQLGGGGGGGVVAGEPSRLWWRY